jgi:serine protease Do
MKKQTINFVVIYMLITLCLGLLVVLFVQPKPLDAEQIYKNNLQSVVELRAFNDETVAVSYGLAVCINNDGTFITNAHVISYKELSVMNEFTIIQIRSANNENYISATLLKIDYDVDLALLKVEDMAFRAVKIRTMNLIEGEKIYAIGNGQNYGISIIEGLVSQRELNVTVDGKTITAIQCGLNITEGNSGGGLFDENGMLIGITTFRLKDALNNVIYGTSFSIPINKVNEFLDNA